MDSWFSYTSSSWMQGVLTPLPIFGQNVDGGGVLGGFIDASKLALKVMSALCGKGGQNCLFVGAGFDIPEGGFSLNEPEFEFMYKRTGSAAGLEFTKDHAATRRLLDTWAAAGEEGGGLSMTDVNTASGAHNALNAHMAGQQLSDWGAAREESRFGIALLKFKDAGPSEAWKYRYAFRLLQTNQVMTVNGAMVIVGEPEILP